MTTRKLDIKTKKLVNNLFLWNYKSAFRWRGLEFKDFINYDNSLDSRNIDWLVSAREWKTLIRSFEEDRELNVLFVFDFWASMNFWIWEKKKIDTLKEIFSVLWTSVIETWWKLWFFIYDDNKTKFYNFWASKKNFFLWLKEIERFNNLDYKNINNQLNFSSILNYRIKNSLVFIISDKTEINESSFKVLSFKNDVVYINIFDNFENTLEWDEYVFWFNNSFKNLFIDNSDLKKRDDYKNLRKNKILWFRKKIYNLWWDYLYIDNKKNIYKELFSLMKQREA